MAASKVPKVAVNDAVNLQKWIHENQSSFLPPVCNKLMHGHGQLKIMFVGGPNIRKDYHIEEGEELFYQVKGDMCLKIIEQGKPKDVVIKQGEIFVLPGRIPHSPQRFDNTVGLVIERERLETETDGLRYYQEKEPTKPLWEKWFHCDDLGSQLGPVIKEYFASQAHKTGVPQQGDVQAPPPVQLDTSTKVDPPFSLATWLADNAKTLAPSKTASLFSKGEFVVEVARIDTTAYHPTVSTDGQVWLWGQSGTATVTVDGKQQSLGQDHAVLLEPKQKASLTSTDAALVLVIRVQLLSN